MTADVRSNRQDVDIWLKCQRPQVAGLMPRAGETQALAHLGMHVRSRVASRVTRGRKAGIPQALLDVLGMQVCRGGQGCESCRAGLK